MILKFVVFLLTVQTAISADLTVQTIISPNSTHLDGVLLDTQKLSPIDTLSYRGVRTPIFTDKEVIHAQPVITVESCPIIHCLPSMLESFECNLNMGVEVDANPLETAGRFNFTQGIVGKLNLSALSFGDFEDTNNTQILSLLVLNLFSHRGTVLIKCLKIENCSRLWGIINTKTSKLYGLRFAIEGLSRIVGNVEHMWKFNGLGIASPIMPNCSWNHVQTSDYFDLISWAEHVNGFWNLDNNYWIGLAALQLITDKKNRPHHKCKLRIELEDWKGKMYWGQWNQFQVMGLKDNYQLKLGEEVKGTLINGLAQYETLQFSKYDNNSYFNETDYNNYFNETDYNSYIEYFRNYLNSSSTNMSCSTRFINVGWWFNPCFSVNINGNYNSSVTKGDAKFNTTDLKSGANFSWVLMKKSQMEVNCS